MQKHDDAIYFDIPVLIASPFEKKIAKVFMTFDFNSVNMVHARDVGSIIKALGCVPSQSEVENVIRSTEFPDHPGDIHLSRFLPFIKKLLTQKKMKSSSPEELLKAFKALDSMNKGYIEKDVFLKLMNDVGEAMTDDELKQMMKSAVDPYDMRVYYEIYLNKLVYEPEDSIYKLAEEQ